MSDLQTLFATDPLLHTKEDIETIIKEFRARRHLFAAGNKQAGSTKPKSEKQKAALDLASKIGDIDL